MTTAEERASALGHDVEWDPPAALTAARRWTCSRCGRAVIDYRGNVYGSAVEQRCDVPADEPPELPADPTGVDCAERYEGIEA